MLASPLLDYLQTSPLPTIVFPASPPPRTSPALSPPLLSNFALTQLTRNRGLLASLSPASQLSLHTWLLASPELSSPTPPSATGPPPDLELELQLSPTSRFPCVWRKSFSSEAGRDFVILVALSFPPTRLGPGQGDEAVPLGSDAPRVLPSQTDGVVFEQVAREWELLCECSAVGLARMDLEVRFLRPVVRGWGFGPG